MCEGPHPFIPAPNTARVELIYTFLGSRVENVLHFVRGDSWQPGELLALANTVDDSWHANLRGTIVDDANLELIRVVDIGVEDGAGVEKVPDAPTNGGVVDTPLPGNVTSALKLSTGQTGRSFRGRIFVIGIGAANISGNQLTVGARDALVTQWQAFISGIEATEDIIHAVVSYCNNGEWRTTAVVTGITGYSMDINLDSMRRRLAGRGQ